MNIFTKLGPAMQSRNYQIYFWSQLFSFIGTGLQMVMVAALVDDITHHSSFWVAMVVFLSMAPSTVLSPILGGVVVDKFDVRRILSVTQSLGLIQALTLAYVATHEPQLWQIITCTVLLSINGSIDSTARHTLMMEIVPDKHIPSAQGLNSLLITSGQAMGGALTGVVFHRYGYAGAFLINAASFIAVIGTLPIFRLITKKTNEEKPLTMLKLGAAYVWAEKLILLQLCLVGLIATVGFSFRGILPAIARELFGASDRASIAQIAGFITAAWALGSVLGALIVSANSESLQEKFKLYLLGGTGIMGSCWIVLAYTHHLWIGLVLMFCYGTGFAASFATVRSTIRQYVKQTNPKMMGRIIGYDFMFFFGGMAIGSLIIGDLGHHFGAAHALLCTGIVIVLITLFLYVFRNKLERANMGLPKV